MSSTAILLREVAEPTQAAYGYLLLGDLHLLLDEPQDSTTSRWLLAILDCLLAKRIRLDAITTLKIDQHDDWTTPGRVDAEFYGKLQRLRDRVAHGRAYALLANELRCDLKELLALGS